MTAAVVRLLPADEHALLKAYVEGTGEPANAAAIYDALEVPAGATPSLPPPPPRCRGRPARSQLCLRRPIRLAADSSPAWQIQAAT
jgi:hypothetical protein